MTRTCEANDWTGEDPRCGECVLCVFKCSDPLPIEDFEYCVFRCGDSLPIYRAYWVAPIFQGSKFSGKCLFLKTLE